MKYSLFMLAFLLSLAVFATEKAEKVGTGTGNGGKARVCRSNDGTITSVELLDYYEAWKVRGMKIDLGPEALTVEQKIDLAMDRLAAIDSYRAEIYRAQAKVFYSEAKPLDGVPLKDPLDSEHIIQAGQQKHPQRVKFDEPIAGAGVGCEYETIVVQIKPRFPEDSRYYINPTLVAYMDNTNKAGLALHEVIYREMINQEIRPQTESNSARYFNSAIAANTLKDQMKTLKDKIEFFRDLLGFNSVTVQGVPISLYKKETRTDRDDDRNIFTSYYDVPTYIEYFPVGTIYHAAPLVGATVFLFNQNLTIGVNRSDDRVFFYESGLIKSIKIKDDSSFDQDGKHFVLGGSMWNNGYSEVSVYESGKFQAGLLKQPIQYQSDEVDVTVVGNVEFYESGEPKYGGKGTVFIQGQKLEVTDAHFYPGLKPEEFRFSQYFNAKVGSQMLTLFGFLKLYPNGQIQRSKIKENTEFQMEGVTYTCKLGAEIYFSESGEVTHVGQTCKKKSWWPF